jgi:hypothetical protein
MSTMPVGQINGKSLRVNKNAVEVWARRLLKENSESDFAPDSSRIDSFNLWITLIF